MNKTSRTSKSIKNSEVAMLFYIATLVLQFFSRKIFLDYLGAEVLGLNTTAVNLLQFLNLAELGISSAVGFTLYKPLLEEDYDTINEIITLQKYLYRNIAVILLIGAGVLMAFFPIIFKDITLPLWYAYGSFGVLIFGALLTYLFNYKQIILTASQHDYLVLYSYKSVMMMKVLFQMIAVWKFSNGYFWWIMLEAIFAIIGSISLHLTTKRYFPLLKRSNKKYKDLKANYPEFTRKIKQLFFHRIGSFALTQAAPLIIYAYTSLTLVGLYGNYLVVTAGLTMLFTALFGSITAGIGNLVAEGNKKHSMEVFTELFSIRFLLITTVLVVAYYVMDDFITVWIGEKYLLSHTTWFLMLLILFINTVRLTVEGFVNAHGLYGDIYAPLIEAGLNVGLSILFGAIWGLNGVLSGVIVSLILVILIWKPYYLFSRVYSGYGYSYILLFLKNLCCFVIGLVVTVSVIFRFISNLEPTIINIVFKVVSLSIIYCLVTCGCMLLLNCGIKNFFNRIRH